MFYKYDFFSVVCGIKVIIIHTIYISKDVFNNKNDSIMHYYSTAPQTTKIPKWSLQQLKKQTMTITYTKEDFIAGLRESLQSLLSLYMYNTIGFKSISARWNDVTKKYKYNIFI